MTITLFANSNFQGSSEQLGAGLNQAMEGLSVKYTPRSAKVPPRIVARFYVFSHWERANADTNPSLISHGVYTPIFKSFDLDSDAPDLSAVYPGIAERQVRAVFVGLRGEPPLEPTVAALGDITIVVADNVDAIGVKHFPPPSIVLDSAGNIVRDHRTTKAEL